MVWICKYAFNLENPVLVLIFDFRPLIQNLDKCEQEIYVNASTTYITSPNYPQNYDNNVNCDWILKSDPLARIVVTIVYVSMESSVRRCRYDVLTIFDGKYGSREDWNRYSRVHISSDTAFLKILKKPSIVQE